MPLLRIHDVHMHFSTQGQVTPALDGVSLDVSPGEMVAVVGESGSGKSATALSILRLLPESAAHYTGGSIFLNLPDGSMVDMLTADLAALRKIRGSQVSMIFQEPMTSLNPVFTCGSQIAEVLRRHRGLTHAQSREAALASLHQVMLPDPGQLYDRYPHQLSGGQKQRVMIAMAVCCQPSLLIADEPTTALDVTVQKGIIRLLKDWQVTHRMGILFITHDLALVRDIADRVVILYQGKVVEQGPVIEIFSHPNHPYTQALLACRPAHYPKGQRLPVVDDFWPSKSVATIVPLPFTPEIIPSLVSPNKTFLDVEDLHVWFAAAHRWFAQKASPVKAVDGVSFSVYEGEILGLVGESGCGKTTLGRALLRLVTPTSGKILVKGQNIVTLRTASLKKYHRQLQIVFQDPYGSLNPRMTIGDALTEVLGVRERLTGTVSSRSMSRVAEAGKLLDKVQLGTGFLRRYPHECSGGQRQRVVIARALAMDPDFILFDESVSALDVSVQAQILNLISDLKKELGFTAVFISHDLSVVRYICDRIIVMRAGRIEETGESEALYAHPESPYTRSLMEAIPGS